MRHRFLAFAIIAASLALKLNGSYASPIDDTEHARQLVAARLEKAGFAVSLAPHQLDAQLGGCKVSARLLDPHGTYRAFFASRLSGGGRVGYAWRGNWQAELPRVGPLFEFFLKREAVRQGIAASRHAVWMVARSGDCGRLSAETFDQPVTMLIPRG